MNSTALILLAILVVLGQGIIIWIMLRRRTETPVDDGRQQAVVETAFSMLQREMQELARTVDKRLHDSSQNVQESMRSQLSESTRIVREVTEGLTKLDETNRQVVSFADQLQSLQDILRNTKQRGVLGEYFLETVLKNTLPPGMYQMQYKIANDDVTGADLIVDAVVMVKNKIIPIDSKFSLENYNRMAETRDPAERIRLEKLFVSDLKTRIKETSKYIRPEAGTMDFAFMFIPHEAIYFDLLSNKIGVSDDNENLIQRAAGTYHVLIVSPTSFHAYLQTVMQGLRGLEIEEKTKEVIKKVEDLNRHMKSYEEYHNKLGTALNTVANHFNASSKEFKKIDKDVLKITGTAIEIESVVVDSSKVLLD